MHTFQFWKSWPLVYQRIGGFIAFVMLVSVCVVWAWYLLYPGPTITTFQIQELETQSIPVHCFQKGPFEFSIAGDNQLIFQEVLGDDLVLNTMAGYFFIALFAICLTFILSIVTLLSRLWYLVGMALYILLVVSLRLEIVQLFGDTTKLFPIFVLSTFVLVSFFFHGIKTTATFAARLLTFLALFIVLTIIIVLFATVPLPVLQIATNGYIAGIILTVLFVISVSHEILASFVYVTTQSTRQSKSLNHFLIISAIYMLNLFLTYLHKINYIDWGVLYIDLILLITLSGLLGLWGFRLREPQYDRIIVADPFGVYFYLAFATLAFATMGYVIGTANDAALQTIYDIILYAHLGYGIIFLTYVFSNFVGMLASNQPVYKVLYKPNRMPYFTFRFGGIVATLAFVFYNTWQVPVNNAHGGYYAAKGDLHLAANQVALAETYYLQSAKTGFLNHHANYALANIEEERLSSYEARSYYERASARRPTEASVLNHADMLERIRQYTQALTALREGGKHFPGSGPIKNATGLAFAKLNRPDSGFYFLNEAAQVSATAAMAKANLFGLAAKQQLPLEIDSVLRLSQSDNRGIQSNALALANLQGQKIQLELNLDEDTLLNLFSTSLINNYILNHLKEVDDSLIEAVLDLADRMRNSLFSEPVLHACALAWYEQGRVREAFDLLRQVTIYASEKGRFNNTLAMWSLEQDAPRVALEFLRYVTSNDFADTGTTSAVAHTEAGMPNAIALWDSLRQNHPDSTIRKASVSMIKVLSANANQLESLSDEEKYLYCRYRINPFDTFKLEAVASTIADTTWQARVFIDRARKLLELDQLSTAVAVYQNISGLSIGRELFEQTQLLELRILAALGNFPLLEQSISNVSFKLEESTGDWMYLTAMLRQAEGDTISATPLFADLAFRNPYDEEAVIAASQYFRSLGPGSLKSYNILAEALLENPYSVRLLKAYALEAMRNGFDQYALSALERLQPLLPPRYVSEFLRTHQQLLAPVLSEIK